MTVSEFNAALIAAGDPQPVQTTVALNGSNLELSVGSDNVGSWPVADLEMERVLGGFKMQVEGETAILRFDDPEPFAEALGTLTGANTKTTKKRAKREPKPKKQPKAKREPKPKRGRKARKAESTSAVAEAAEAKTTESRSKSETKSLPAGGMTKLDARLERWSKRWGNYLPDWIFTKGGMLVLLGVLLMIIAKPGWFSIIFLILAAVGLAASAIAMLDQVVATRIFRRGYTPIHGLILSLMIGLIGILLGAV